MNPVDIESLSNESMSSTNDDFELKDDTPWDYIPEPNAVDISQAKDGRLLKQIIKEGEPGPTVQDGMTVFVHYIGRLTDGTVFDQSDRNVTPFSFTVGKGSVIKGWDEGINTMKKGEVAYLICHPKYAYADRPTGNIPANSTLIFEMEVMYWLEEDLTLKKTREITRLKISEGPSKYLNPTEGSTVTIELKGSYNGVEFDQRTVTFPMGEGAAFNIPYGVEKGLYKFSDREISVLTLGPKYAYGSKGNQEFGVPPDATVQYKVELKSLEKAKEVWQMDGLEKITASKEFKEKGTTYFKAGNYVLAGKLYKRIVDFLKAEALLTGDNETERKSLLCAAYLNQAICFLKMDQPVQALNCADDALALEPNNEKGIYRRGLANLGIREPEVATNDFLRVLALDPNNKAAAQQLVVCQRQVKDHKAKEKQIYSKMFDKFAKIDKARDIAALKKQPNGLDNLDEWGKSENTQNNPTVELIGNGSSDKMIQDDLLDAVSSA